MVGGFVGGWGAVCAAVELLYSNMEGAGGWWVFFVKGLHRCCSEKQRNTLLCIDLFHPVFSSWVRIRRCFLSFCRNSYSVSYHVCIEVKTPGTPGDGVGYLEHDV